MFISKRMLIIVGVVVVVVMLAAGVGVAYAFSALGQQSSASVSATATASALASPTPRKATGQRRVLGVIKSLSNQSFVLTIDKGKRTITVNIDGQTKYGHAGKAATFSDLQVGETVAVQGTYNAASKTMTATRITISPKVATPTPTTSPTATATP